MFTLIAIGVGAAYFFSAVAMLMPGLFPHAMRHDGKVEIEVADDGPGLPPKAVENLFRPFRGSARAGGTGLGLAIARELARVQGGDLKLAESSGRGARFAIELPDRKTA